MHSGRTKVLYIAGVGRSGSTLLNNLLGGVEGFFSAGEFCYIWNRGLVKNRLCSCGAPFAECKVWSEVVEEAFGGASGVDAREMDRVQKGSTRLRQLPLTLTPGGRRRLEDRWGGTFRRNLARIYRAMQDVTGNEVIVDGSKLPLYGHVLGTMPEIDLYVLHLVRDPRAVAHSWTRKKAKPLVGGVGEMPRRSPVGSALEWDVGNAATRSLLGRSPERYLLLRYEDFMESPRSATRRVLEFVGEGEAPLPFVSEHGARLGTNHNIGGNPTRFRTGTVELRPDREWAWKMKARDRALVSALTLPFLSGYGYPISVPREG